MTHGLISVSSTNIATLDGNQTISGNKTFTGNVAAVTQESSDNSTKVATTAFVKTAVGNVNVLPDQTDQNGKFLTTNGSSASWATVDLSSKQDTINDLSDIRAGASAGATALQPNTAITGATKTKITYDANGLVTSGADLSATDIPSLTLSKISDVTASASELNILDGATVTTSEINVLDGITATTTELNYVDGVTSSIQTQLNAKQATIDDLSDIRSGASAGATALQPNTAITGATKTKITYDTNGLVTAGADLSASDIPDLSSTYLTTTLKGAPNGLAELDSNGLVPSEQLPSYVDDIIDLLNVTDTAPSTCAKGDKYYNSTSKKIFTATSTDTWGATGKDPESGKIYVNLNDNSCYRWSGSALINISNPIEYATTTTAGIVEFATDNEASTGTAENLVVNPKQLATKVTANSAITGATKTKITYDSKGLVTSGADLEASDIPSLSLSKISDVTATASELNVLDGITASTAELNVLDGITATTTELNYVDGVTSSIQTQLNSKEGTIADLSDIRSGAAAGATALQPNAAITGATKCKVTYDANGLVTAGADLTASDIPSLTLSKISDVTATATELNYVDGVTSSIQTQLNAKAPLASPTLTGTPAAPTAAAGTNTTQIATTAFVKTAIDNAAPVLDNTTVSYNNSSKIQAIGTIDKNSGNAIYNWKGTLAEYNAGLQAGTIPSDWVCYITDDFNPGVTFSGEIVSITKTFATAGNHVEFTKKCMTKEYLSVFQDRIFIYPNEYTLDDDFLGITFTSNIAQGSKVTVNYFKGVPSEKVNELITAANTIEQTVNVIAPAGSVMIWAGTTVPTGYLLCDGAAVSRTTYSALFSAIGTTYGVGDGSSTFNLPNFTGRYLKQGTVGTYGSESLPNITGRTGYNVTSTGDAYLYGAFYPITTTGDSYSPYSSGSSNRKIGFDASRSSSTYQNNAKVNPDNAEILYVIKY